MAAPGRPGRVSRSRRRPATSNDGGHTIDYYSIDNVGNVEAVKQATVTIDTQPPSGSPVDPGSILRGTVTLSDPSPADAGGGVGSVAFEYSLHGANSWTTIGTRTSAPWAVLFDTTAVPDGQYDLREVISDAAVPPNVTTIDLPGPQLIDNTPPSSAIVTAPAAGAFAGGTVTLAGTAADSASGVGQMVFKINGTVVGTTSGSPASVDWDSTSIPDGPATVTLEAMDVAGNGPTVSAGRTFVVDNNPPAVTLDTPGAASSGTVVLSTTTSSDTIQVTFERSPAGAANWSTIAVDSTRALLRELRHEPARRRAVRPESARERRIDRRSVERAHDADRQHPADRIDHDAHRRRHRRLGRA